VADLPRLVQLHEQFGDRVVGITLNVDYDGSGGGLTPQLKDKIVSVLEKLNITANNVIASEPTDAVLNDFDIFGLPAVAIYNSQGELHKVFDGTVSYDEQVFPEVAQLLASD
jgi:hypothetical protein